MDDLLHHIQQMSPSTDEMVPGAIPSIETVQEHQTHPLMVTIVNFQDFITCDLNHTIPVGGTLVALEALDSSIRQGCYVKHVSPSYGLGQYQPLEQALAAACLPLNLPSMSAKELYEVHQSENLAGFFPRDLMISTERYEQLEGALASAVVTLEVMVALVDMFCLMHNMPDLGMQLGFVMCGHKQMPMAYTYPSNNITSGPTAWIIIIEGQLSISYQGIGGVPVHSPFGLSVSIPGMPTITHSPSSVPSLRRRQSRSSSASSRTLSRGTANSTTPASKNGRKASRGTGTSTKLLQVPLQAGLHPDEMLENYAHKLSYNNMLKVALHYSNHYIAKICQEAPIQNKTSAPSAIVKRIVTGCRWIEEVFGIKKDAFRTHFDRQRSAVGITSRQNNQVAQEVIDQNWDKIVSALEWVKRGGPLDQEMVERFNISHEFLFDGVRPEVVGGHQESGNQDAGPQEIDHQGHEPGFENTAQAAAQDFEDVESVTDPGVQSEPDNQTPPADGNDDSCLVPMSDIPDHLHMPEYPTWPVEFDSNQYYDPTLDFALDPNIDTAPFGNQGVITTNPFYGVTEDGFTAPVPDNGGSGQFHPLNIGGRMTMTMQDIADAKMGDGTA